MTETKCFLTGSTALVTGAAKRLGRSVALALAEAGADVVAHYRRSQAEAEDLAETIRDMGRKAWTVQADLGVAAEAGSVMPRAIEAAGPIDILINNASFFDTGTILDTTAEQLAANVQLHVAAPMVMAQAMAAQGRPGRIVNFLDSRMVDYDREHAAYHMSKRMLFTLTRMLALELAPDIEVNAVAPGLILPPAGEGEDYLQRLASTNPLNRHGDAEEIARAVLFLLGSQFVTGQVLYIDGGRHMKGSVYHP